MNTLALENISIKQQNSMKYGYARVSKLEQNLSSQISALKKDGCSKIFIDKASGKNKARVGLEEALNTLQKGDCLVICRLDRLGRSLPDLISLMDTIKNKEAAIRSLSEYLDTSTPTGNLIFQVFGAIAQFERGLLIERTMAGLAEARKKGRIGGRRPITEDKIIQLNVLKRQGLSPSQIYKQLKIGRTTYYKYLSNS